MLFTVDPRLRWQPISAIHLAGIAVPWVLEAGGVLSETTTSLNGDLLLRSQLVMNRMPESEIALFTFTIAPLVIAGFTRARPAQAPPLAVPPPRRRGSGLVKQSKPSSRGASNARVKTISRSDGVVTVSLC